MSLYSTETTCACDQPIPWVIAETSGYCRCGARYTPGCSHNGTAMS